MQVTKTSSKEVCSLTHFSFLVSVLLTHFLVRFVDDGQANSIAKLRKDNLPQEKDKHVINGTMALEDAVLPGLKII